MRLTVPLQRQGHGFDPWPCPAVGWGSDVAAAVVQVSALAQSLAWELHMPQHSTTPRPPGPEKKKKTAQLDWQGQKAMDKIYNKIVWEDIPKNP